MPRLQSRRPPPAGFWHRAGNGANRLWLRANAGWLTHPPEALHQSRQATAARAAVALLFTYGTNDALSGSIPLRLRLLDEETACREAGPRIMTCPASKKRHCFSVI